MEYKETRSEEETEKLYQQFLKENHTQHSEAAYNAFYNGAELCGFTVEIVMERDVELSKKCGMFIPSGKNWYELHKRP